MDWDTRCEIEKAELRKCLRRIVRRVSPVLGAAGMVSLCENMTEDELDRQHGNHTYRAWLKRNQEAVVLFEGITGYLEALFTLEDQVSR